MFKRVIVLIIMVILVGVGVSLTLKGAIGVGAWDALVSTISNSLGISFGTMAMGMNCTCVVVQILILKKEFKKIQLLQFVISILFSYIIDFVLYTLLGSFSVESYAMRVALLIGGQIICAFAVGAVMVMDMVTFPLEGACMAVSKKTGKKFHVLRQAVDIFCVLAVLVLVWIVGTELTVREGTIIGALMFGPLMGVFMKVLKPIFKKRGLLHTE